MNLINICICVLQSPYKYVVVVFITSIILKLPRFFQFKLIETVDGETDYWTTSIMEDPVYIRFSSYWDDLIVTGFLPLILIIYFNLKIYLEVNKMKISKHLNQVLIYCIVVIWISMNSFVLFRFADLQGWNVTDLLVAEWWKKIFKCANQTQLVLLRISKMLIHVRWWMKNKDVVPDMQSHLLNHLYIILA